MSIQAYIPLTISHTKKIKFFGSQPIKRPQIWNHVRASLAAVEKQHFDTSFNQGKEE